MNNPISGNRADTRAVVPALTKVLHVITGDLYAGAERVQDLLADGLPAFGYEVSFVCLKHGTFQQQLAAGPRETSTIAMRSRFDVVRTARAIARRARATGSQIIHTHTARGALVGSIAAAMTGLPLAHHVHSPTLRDTTNPLANWINAVVGRGSLLRARAIIPVSNSLAHHVAGQGHPAARICTVHNGVAINTHERKCLAHRGLALGMVALFRPRKGIEVLLQAMAKLITRGQLVHLRAVGAFEDPHYERQILALAEGLGLSPYIEWRGFRRDVVDELSVMDALVLPSLFGEGMPMVILEAMAAGLPIIASSVEGVPEAVRDGQEGYLVQPGDVDALADALARLLCDRVGAQAMGSAARSRQRAMFSDRAMASGTAHIYDRLLGRNRMPTLGEAVAS
jgi:glycosyltransferase involved in cell wall biosynthesis